jgi:hypothetical protein
VSSAAVSHDDQPETRSVRSFCRICTAICGIVVDVVGDRIVRVRGDGEHPLSRGSTCPKGRAVPAIHHHPDRVERPGGGAASPGAAWGFEVLEPADPHAASLGRARVRRRPGPRGGSRCWSPQIPTRRPRAGRGCGPVVVAAVLTVLAMALAACSDDDAPPDTAAASASSSSPDTVVAASSTTSSQPDTSAIASSTTEAAATALPVERTPHVDAAVLEGPITVGELSPPADPRAVDLAAIGYVQEEFFASGTATAYATDEPLGEDGRWSAAPAATAPYRTRFLVRRPSDPERFNGTVVVEWLNVTVVETAPEWAYTSRAIIDAGAAWVGVSAQALGIVGGTPAIPGVSQASAGIRADNPERYGSLEHPGDQYAFDIVSQIGAAIRSPGQVPVLGQGIVRSVVAAGESQSAAFLTTYVNAVQPVANVFDGFFVHSRGSGAAGLDGSLGMRGVGVAYRFRTDLDAPIVVFETETDVGPLLGYAAARQPDTDGLRTWEVAGTAHADAYLVGGTFALCPGGINTGPQHYVATAALEALMVWVEGGAAPPHGDPIQTAGADGTTIARDGHGIALGGVRTPSVDVPVAALTGEAPAGAELLCALFGGGTPFDGATLTSLYPDQQAYLDAFDGALDRAIGLGFVRAADRDEFAAEARTVPF